ncbi:MAG: DUF4382 domain-containing protein [Chloroflexi bacterium]|nr:DUF4382 domain-containing protein [Chloroflexota bacterium]
MAKKAFMLVVASLLTASLLIIGCSSDNDEGADATDDASEVGTLEFNANGEDFVRQGFVSKDGWSVTFDHVYITLSNITAYQTDPPYDAHEDGKVEVKLDGIHTVDLAEGDETAAPIFVGEISDAATGHYNTIFWRMDRADSGPSAGYSLVMIGIAEKDGHVEDFSIKIDSICRYSCGEYVGDERKGILSEGSTADMEMTFHFDHLFGDADIPADDELNLGALGFEALLEMPEGGDPDINMAELHLGHVGEGHCFCECE